MENLQHYQKKEKESNHKSAYTRLKEIKPELFTDCDILDGYESASILAANDKVVIWPTNINKADIIIITMPKLMDNNQCKTLKQFFYHYLIQTFCYIQLLLDIKKEILKK